MGTKKGAGQTAPTMEKPKPTEQAKNARLLKSMPFSLRNLYIAVAMRRNRRSAGRSGHVEE